MKIEQDFFNESLNKNYIFEKNPFIAVGVSGGPDSMCLLFLLNNWIKIKKGKLKALIINHQIRDESDLETKNIKKYLLNYKIDSSIIKVVKNKVEKKNMNEARVNRYEVLLNYCKKKSILHLFIGHHQDDNLETFILRRLAGSNFEGLRSIQNKMINNHLQIIRPLLGYKKKDILNYNQLNNIYYINDSSNKNLKYSRVVVRSFLENTNIYNKVIKKDFNQIIENYPFYKKMIYEFFNLIVLKIEKNKIYVISEIFFNLNQEIKTKIIEIIYKYLMPERKNLRYNKIVFFLKLLQDAFSCKKYHKINLAGMYIKNDELNLIFSR